MNMLVDSHCHLDLAQFDDDRTQVIERARAAGIGLIVNPGIDLAHCRQALHLAEDIPELYVAVGIHPNDSSDFSPATLDELRTLAARPKVVAIGEIGLDYYWKKVAPDQQQIAFEAQLELAAQLGLPVIIHCREANEDVAQTLERWVSSTAMQQSALRQRPFWGVLHAFPGDRALAERAYSWNFVLGLGGPVTYQNAKSLHNLLPELRLDRLMLETDAPYLTPHPHRGKRNEPAYIPLICRQIANLMDCSESEVATATTEVARQFFGLEQAPGAKHAISYAHTTG